MALNGIETQRDSIQPGGQHPHFALHRVFQNSELRLDSGGWTWLEMAGHGWTVKDPKDSRMFEHKLPGRIST